VPTVKLDSQNFKETQKFLVDSGSGPNIIKKDSLTFNTMVDENEILKLSGITAHHVTTLGQARIDILGCPVVFHLVENDFPIPQNGILGSDFFKQFQVNVNYQQNCLEWEDINIPFEPREDNEETLIIPGRAISQMHIKIANPELKEGYVPRLNVIEGIYLGNALVTVRDKKEYLQVINTNEKDHEIYVPTIKIYEFEANESLTNSNTNTNSKSNTISNSNSNSNTNSISNSNSNTDSSLDSNSNTNSDSDSNSNEGLINTILSINVNSKIIPDSKSRTNFHENLNEREKKIIDMLRLDHLNFEERIHVEDLI